jgi:hypothetical protein
MDRWYYLKTVVTFEKRSVLKKMNVSKLRS